MEKKKQSKPNNDLEQYMNQDHEEEIIDLDEEESVRAALKRTFDKEQTDSNEDKQSTGTSKNNLDNDMKTRMNAYNGKESSQGKSTQEKSSQGKSSQGKSAWKKNSKENAKSKAKKAKDISGNANKKNHSIATVLNIVLACSTFFAVLLCLVLLIRMSKASTETNSDQVISPEVESPVYYDEAQVNALIETAKQEGAEANALEMKEYIRSIAENKNPNFAEMLRRLYPENIIYLDSNGYQFVPITDAYVRNGIAEENLVMNSDGYMTYTGTEANGLPANVSLGIDVSQHQGNVDWMQVKDAGFSFAIIRMGFRGYGSGALVEDEQFRNNVEGATSAGLEVGVYFFTQAISEEEAIEEAQMLLEGIRDYTISGPIILDIEKPDDNSARANSLSAAERTRITKAFADTITQAGYPFMIYGNLYTLFNMLEFDQIAEYDLWFAFYNDYLYYPYELKMWQYTANGSVPGVSGNVDINIRFQ